MDMDLIVKWASIASPLIAVIIAVLSGVSSRRATAKQLAAIEESTAKQVASIQNLEAQLAGREKQYEYYRNKLLTFE